MAAGADADAGAVSEASEQALIRVHVCGAVKKSGVYQLQEGALVQDAVRAAGGVRKDGAQDYLNLAGRLEDGQKVYVPFLKDVDDPYGLSAGSGGQDMASSGYGSGQSGSDAGTGQAGTGQPGSGAEVSGQGLVNINTADADLLMTLPGIGESKASAILTYREKNGAFSRIEDIMNVSGIKEGAFAKIEDLITV
ncbi:MAG: helix-hairpin-helix domain-containing protein [Lachnospiraceae bacterium]|nr:helix-hairpin-helix domain-containing protein [Lachnospiraceae bacterium]